MISKRTDQECINKYKVNYDDKMLKVKRHTSVGNSSDDGLSNLWQLVVLNKEFSGRYGAYVGPSFFFFYTLDNFKIVFIFRMFKYSNTKTE